MKVVLQRVRKASVTVEGSVTGEIKKGFLLFIGVSHTDTEDIARKMADKISKLRIFEDGAGKTNLSLSDVSGDILAVSQFTLYADCKKGNRPSFTKAGGPEHANHMYEYMVEHLRTNGHRVEKGIFGADMKVELLNDGPFTLVLDSDEICS